MTAMIFTFAFKWRFLSKQLDCVIGVVSHRSLLYTSELEYSPFTMSDIFLEI